MKVFAFITSILSFSNAQQLVGSQHDNHGCVSDGGYQWCETTQSCVRPWMTPCPRLIIEPPVTQQTSFCSTSTPQLCRMMCPPPRCNVNQCAVRRGMCCDYICQDEVQSSGHRRLNENRLNEGDVCFRFCEDNSQTFLDRRNECPSGTTCQHSVSNQIGFDLCGNNAYTCQISNH